MSLLSSSIVHGPRLSPTFSQQGCLPIARFERERERERERVMLQWPQAVERKTGLIIYRKAKILTAHAQFKLNN